jgi:hypothetical protein
MSCVHPAKVPQETPAGNWEVNNTTPCTAKVFTGSGDLQKITFETDVPSPTKPNSLVSTSYGSWLIGEVPGGERKTFTLPRLSPGITLFATSNYVDGRECEGVRRITIRRVDP